MFLPKNLPDKHRKYVQAFAGPDSKKIEIRARLRNWYNHYQDLNRVVVHCQAAEKKERDSQVDGANFCNLVERTIRVHNDCNVLRTQLGPDQQTKSNLHNLGTDIRQAAAAMAKVLLPHHRKAT